MRLCECKMPRLRPGHFLFLLIVFELSDAAQFFVFIGFRQPRVPIGSVLVFITIGGNVFSSYTRFSDLLSQDVVGIGCLRQQNISGGTVRIGFVVVVDFLFRDRSTRDEPCEGSIAVRIPFIEFVGCDSGTGGIQINSFLPNQLPFRIKTEPRTEGELSPLY